MFCTYNKKNYNIVTVSVHIYLSILMQAAQGLEGVTNVLLIKIKRNITQFQKIKFWNKSFHKISKNGFL